MQPNSLRMKSMNHWHTSFLYKILFCSLFLFGLQPYASSQVTLEVTVLDGGATTPTCGGLLDAGEPVVSLIVENKEEISYSSENCPNIPDFPNLQYDTTLSCLSDLSGGEIHVCLRTYFREFTGFLGNNRCEIPNSGFRCGNNICANILLPTPGNDSIYTVEIPQSLGLDSYGFITFRINVSEDASLNPHAENDRICHAINMGTLSQGGTLGDKQIGSFNNYCATAFTEPSPHDVGTSWQNNVATWFSFTTSNDPNALILVEATSDPENINDPVNLQLALYESDDDSCEGNLQLLADNFEGRDIDEYLILSCLEPNKKYFLMVDGEVTTPGLLNGVFGLQFSEVSIEPQTNDEICNAVPITVSSGGAITEKYSNHCATNTGDPTTSFPITNSVWFQFTPSESRRVFINIDSDLPYPLGTDAIDPEIAVFYSPTNDCNGLLVEVANQNTTGNVNAEFLSLECLNPKLTYYILVDGAEDDPSGIFSVTVAERGYPDPIEENAFICRGDVYNIGDKVYANEGIYIDTLVENDDCIVIIETTLNIVEPIDLDLRIGSLARGDGQGGGAMIASAQFGTGDYTFEWSNGQDGIVANNLIGGDQYCVNVIDNNAGCMADTCFTMEFPVPIGAIIENDSLNCSYDLTGTLPIRVAFGKPPYEVQVQGIEDPSFFESTVIVKNDTTVLIADVPVGNYNIFIKNLEDVQHFVAEVVLPPAIEVALVNQINATCFEGCDGSISLDVSGGTGTYNFTWDNNLASVQNPTNICAGIYNLTITDENNCRDSSNFVVTEPPAPIVTFSNIEPVQCFDKRNGQATIEVNEPINGVLWDNGANTETVDNLDAGVHQVTIINENGCESTAEVEISQPDAALIAVIDTMETIACGGDFNGILADASTGGNGNYQYSWSNGSTDDFIEDLPAGSYTLTVRDEKGCEDETTAILEEPTPISATVSVQDVTCPSGENSGIIFINNPSGGTPPYRFSADNQPFISNTEITNLPAGTYAVLMQDEKGCEIVFDRVVVNSPPEVIVNLGGDREIKLGTTLELKATVNRRVNFAWSSSDTLSCLNCTTASSRPFDNATYSVIVTDVETGCIAEDEISISVLKARNLYVPNVFSPNGDGINDQLILLGGPDIIRVLNFEVYARSGARVFRQNNFTINEGIGWDGTFDQEELNPDIFLYFAEIEFIDGATALFRGDFTLIR